MEARTKEEHAEQALRLILEYLQRVHATGEQILAAYSTMENPK